jgi:hypothetical protein
MSLLAVANGVTGLVIRIKLLDSSQSFPKGLTGLTSASAGLNISAIADTEASTTSYTQGGSTIQTIATLGTYAAPSTSNCRFKEVDATNHPGVYEMQFANARFSVSGARSLLVSISGAVNLVQCDFVVQLTTFDLNSSVNAVGAAASVTGAVGSVTGNVGGITGVTLPAAVASPTNITAGTITTVTSLTNAPTAGDLTAVMKTSVQAAANAAVVALEPLSVTVAGYGAGQDPATLLAAALVSVAPAAGTWGEAMAFALAGIGKSKIVYAPPSGVNTNDGVLTVYAKDGTTVLKSFTGVNVDSSGNTTVRV